MKKLMMIGLLIGMSSISLCAQEESDKLRLSGSLQSDMLLAQKDSTIGAEATDGRFLTNTYLDLKLSSRYVEAGARLEYLKHPLPGYENDFKGWGVPYAYLKGRYKNAELTLGSFYEQFGSGFILRSYEERSLGIDNSLQGARLNYRPWAGVAVKVLTGRQRRYWNHNKSWMTGADVEWNIDEVYDDWQHETGVRLVAVSIDQAQNVNKVKPMVDQNGWRYDVLLDPNGEFRRSLGIQSVPYTVLLDGQGKIVYKHNGYTDGAEVELYNKVKEAAGK